MSRNVLAITQLQGVINVLIADINKRAESHGKPLSPKLARLINKANEFAVDVIKENK